MIESYRDLEARRVKRLRKEYEAKGYTVNILPDPSSLPKSMGHYQPDMIARKGEDVLVFEVRSRETLTHATQLEGMAKAIEKIPGWEFVLVVTNPRSPIKDIDLPSVETRLYQAEELFNKGYQEASLLLLWAVAESSLRQIARKNKIRVKTVTSSFLAKKLYSEGLLNQRDYSALENLAKQKHLVTYGNESKTYSSQSLLHEFQIVSELLRRNEIVQSDDQ